MALIKTGKKRIGITLVVFLVLNFLYLIWRPGNIIVNSLVIILAILSHKSMKLKRKAFPSLAVQIILYMTVITFIGYIMKFVPDLSYYYHEVIETYIFIGLGGYILYLHEDPKDFYIGLRNVALVLSMLGIIEFFTKFNFFSYITNGYGQSMTQEGRIFSIFGHSIIYGAFLSIALIVLYFYPFKLKGVNYAAVILCILNIILSQSRSSIVAVAGLIIILVAIKIIHFIRAGGLKRNKNKRKRVMEVLLLIPCGLILLFIIFRNPMVQMYWSTFTERLYSIRDLTTQAIRVEGITSYFEYIKHENIAVLLFGKGCGYSMEYLLMHPLHGWWTASVDNQYIAFLFDYGVIGTLVLFYSFFKSVNIFYLSIRRKNEPNIIIGSCSIILLSIGIFFYNGLNWYSVFFLYIYSICNMMLPKNNGIEIPFQSDKVYNIE